VATDGPRLDPPFVATSPNVAFVCWNGILGGAQTLTVEIAGALRRRNVDAHVVFVCETDPLAGRADALGVPWVTVGLGRGRDVLHRPRRLAATIGEHGADAAVLVSSGYLAGAARVGGYSAPLVAIEHGTFLQVERLPSMRRALRRLDRRSGLWACSVEVAVSEFLLRELDRRPHAASLVCIPNGVDTSRFAPEVGAASSGRPTIGCAARLVPGKGVDDLLRAAALLRRTGVRWSIAGDGPDRVGLETLADSLSLGGAVEFLGRVDDMPSFWRSCSIGVVPSRDWIESFGLVAIEAMATGVPVVATHNGGLTEVVGENAQAGVLVEPGAPASLASAIERLLGDEDLRATYGRNGRKRVEQLYSLDACADSYARLIESVVEGRMVPA
jgi:glycosyltransferase involved in cell wall biosynthesis